MNTTRAFQFQCIESRKSSHQVPLPSEGNTIALPSDEAETDRPLGDQVQDTSLESTVWDVQPPELEEAVDRSLQPQQHRGEENLVKTQDGEGPSDYWDLRPMCLVRMHLRPRKQLFAPDRCEEAPPIPLDHLDVTRVTKTSLENDDEKYIEDVEWLCW